MEIETSVETRDIKQDQLPQIRRISKLDDLRQVLPPKTTFSLEKKPTIPPKHRNLIPLAAAGVIFAAIFSFELGVIYKYDKLNKRLYQISVSHKNEAAGLQKTLQYVSKSKEILGSNRRLLLKNYTALSSRQKILQFNMQKDRINYEGMLQAKINIVNTLEGDLRVASARIESVNAQNELLQIEVNSKNEYVKQLTEKLVHNIDQQKILVNENLRLKQNLDQLSQGRTALNIADENQITEKADVN